MTTSNILSLQIKKTSASRVVWLAVFIAVSSVIQIFDNELIPSSLPFKSGVANVVTLIVITSFGPVDAILVTAVRTILAALVTGRLFSIPFLMSFSGGVASAAVMGLLYGKFRELSIVGVSITGAVTHNLVQLLLIYGLLIHNRGIFNLAPLLLTFSLLTGLMVGFLARAAINLPLLKKVTVNGVEKGTQQHLSGLK